MSCHYDNAQNRFSNTFIIKRKRNRVADQRLSKTFVKINNKYHFKIFEQQIGQRVFAKHVHIFNRSRK